jgi:hypothetical protein
MKAQTLGRVLLGSAMVGAGALHLTTQRQELQAPTRSGSTPTAPGSSG